MLAYFKQNLWIPYWLGMAFNVLAAISPQINPVIRMALFAIGLIWAIVFIYIGVTEVRQNNRISNQARNLWTWGLIISSSIVGLLYLYLFRNRYGQNL